MWVGLGSLEDVFIIFIVWRIKICLFMYFIWVLIIVLCKVIKIWNKFEFINYRIDIYMMWYLNDRLFLFIKGNKFLDD